MNLLARTRIVALHALVLGVGLLLSGLTYFFGGRVMDATDRLVNEDLPALKTISGLKADVIELEPILYEYYVSGNRQRYLARMESVNGRIEEGFEVVQTAFPGGRSFADISARHAQIKALARELDLTLASRPVDGSKAEQLIRQISNACASINQELDDLVDGMQKRVRTQGQQSRSQVIRIVVVVASFSGALFLVVLVAGHYFNAYLDEVAARRRLAMFPERNPNPVLSLGPDGIVAYANPGAREMVRQMGLTSLSARDLLPENLEQRLERLRQAGGGYEHWEYSLADRSFGCGIHFLPDFEVFHTYLSDITDRKRAEARLIHHAYHDALTGLPNRHKFQEQVRELLANGASAAGGAVLLLTIDRFYLIIDSLGRGVADRVLQAAAESLAALIADSPLLASQGALYRFDGEQFAILTSLADRPSSPVRLAEAVLEASRRPVRVDGREYFLTYSIGSSLFPADAQDPFTLVRNADSAMHAVSRTGGNGYHPYAAEMAERAVRRLETEGALRHALEREEFEVHYQPQMDLRTGRVVGAEALVRWRHPVRGLVSPAEFIPVAEESGLILEIGEHVLDAACRQARKWMDSRPEELVVAVNVSAHQLTAATLPGTVTRVLRESGLKPQCLELEITESVAMQDVERTIAVLAELKRMGVRLAIDDFGTGYSSMSYLQRLPIHKLKLDGSFVRNLPHDPNDAAIARAVITLGHGLGLRVIAEGVETWEQSDFLAAAGCDEIQGYVISRPVPAHDFPALMTGAPLSGSRIRPVAKTGTASV
ncbi:MAG: bifunctional diguanylate cyclase/phosphodiesterase [Betaproteobacteria bacterium]|nr:bifunctional diguanylate cyclase/phosphodiesterase [Betaproteobacteria bacterium]